MYWPHAGEKGRAQRGERAAAVAELQASMSDILRDAGAGEWTVLWGVPLTTNVKPADQQDAQPAPVSALGWSVGAGTTADILGADPSYGSIGVAGPIATSDGGTFSLRLEDLQLYVRISQTF